MKKLLSMVTFTFLFSMIFISTASASAHGSHSHAGEEGEINPLYIPCEGTGGKHIMTGRGKGQVILTNEKYFSDDLYQCISCPQGLILTNLPHRGFSAPEYYVPVTLPDQAINGHDFTSQGPVYFQDYAFSWNYGIFSSITFPQ